MSEWISVKDTPPPKKNIIIFCKQCKQAHSVLYDYQTYCLAECCGKQGPYFAGETSDDFDYWMPLPEPPK